MKLRQVCCDPRIVSVDGARRVKRSAKYDLFFDLLDTERLWLPGHEDLQPLASREPATFRLRTGPDREPQVQAKLTGISTLVTPRALIPIAGRVTDDFGIADLRLQRRWRGEKDEADTTGTDHLHASAGLPARVTDFETVLDLPGDGFADGGDVLTTRESVMIGLSARTNKVGAEALQACLAKLGRKSEIVATPEGVLHFKTDCSLLDDETGLSTARLAKSDVFERFKQVIIPEGEEPAANALRVNDVVMVGSDFPRTIETLDKLGYKVVPMKTTEIGKIDAGLSCMSLRWFDPAPIQSGP